MRMTRTVTGRGWRCIVAPAAVFLFAAGLLALGLSCSGPKATEPRKPREVEVPAYLKDTVGELARFAGREFIPVRGYGFVTGLDGTGTRVVPPGIRQYILDVMRKNKVEDAEKILTSPDTAVVLVSGLLSPGINKSEVFDLNVQAVPSTETTSLEGGFLLEAELSRVVTARGVSERSETLALGRGSIFVWPFGADEKSKSGGDLRTGRILAGGRATNGRRFRLVLLTPSVRTIDQMIRIINARFPNAAKGTTDPARIDLEVPREYQHDQTRFLDLVGCLYLRETLDARDQRINLLIESLGGGKDLDSIALCLEAFGPSVVPRLRPLADDPREVVRFHVGRTLANLQDAQAVHVLERIALDDKSDYQEGAVEALGRIQSGVGLGVLGRVLDVKNARARVAAWRAMIRLTPGTFVVRSFPDKFVLSAVATKTEPFVYVSRTLRPHLAVFGDVTVVPPVLVETHRVTATVVGGAKEVTLIARRRGHDLRIEAPLDVKGMVEKLAAPFGIDEKNSTLRGLDLGYSDVVGILYEMSRKQALSGPIVLQPLEIRISGDRPVARPITPEEALP